MEELNDSVIVLDEVDKMLEVINEKLEDNKNNNIDKEKMLKDINELIDNFEVE